MTIMQPQLQPLVLLTSLHSPSCLCQLLGSVSRIWVLFGVSHQEIGDGLILCAYAEQS